MWVCVSVGAWQIDGLISSATKRLQLWHLQLASNFVPHLLAKSFWTARLKSSGHTHTHATETKDSERAKLAKPKSRQHFYASLNFDACARFICLYEGEGGGGRKAYKAKLI